MGPRLMDMDAMPPESFMPDPNNINWASRFDVAIGIFPMLLLVICPRTGTERPSSTRTFLTVAKILTQLSLG